MKYRLSGLTEYLKREKKTVIVSLIATCLVFILVCVKEYRQDSIYFAGERGSLEAIDKGDREYLSTVVEVTGFKDGVSLKKSAVLSIGGEKKKADSSGDAEEENPGESIGKAIDEAVRKLETAEGSYIKLPRMLEDGTLLMWEKPERREKYLILLMFPAMIMFFYKGEREKDVRAEKMRKDSVIMSLPSFNSQILLLLGSGLIFEEAFSRIASGYSAKAQKNYFEEMIAEIRQKSVETNVSAAKIMDSYASRIGVREFTRIKEIILTAQYKGNDLSEKLAEEGELLWNKRKKNAEERGKLAETKLSGPLAILLLALIAVTAAPAMMQMS